MHKGIKKALSIAIILLLIYVAYLVWLIAMS